MMGYAKSPMRAHTRAGSKQKAKRQYRRVEVAMVVDVGCCCRQLRVPLFVAVCGRWVARCVDSSCGASLVCAHNERCEKISDYCDVGLSMPMFKKFSLNEAFGEEFGITIHEDEHFSARGHTLCYGWENHQKL